MLTFFFLAGKTAGSEIWEKALSADGAFLVGKMCRAAEVAEQRTGDVQRETENNVLCSGCIVMRLCCAVAVLCGGCFMMRANEAGRYFRLTGRGVAVIFPVV